MKLYTDKSQTAKLIELGFEKPKNALPIREEKGIHIEIVATACGYFWIADETNGTAITDSDVLDRGTNEGGCFDTYELALEDALKYVLENLV